MSCKSYHDIIDTLLVRLHKANQVDSLCYRFRALPFNQKVSFTYRLLEERKLLPNPKHESVKSESQAADCRAQGNAAFCRKQEAEALKCYSRSVRLSLPNSPGLSLAYGNRSAVLFEVEKFDLCLLDINRALKNYPDNLKYKLYQRKGKCLQKIGSSSEAKQSFQNAQNYLLRTEFNTEKRDALKISLDQSIDECDKSGQNENIINSIKNFPLPELPSKNSLIPNASHKIRINSSLEMGRHLIASQDIEPGEILAAEKPYASILLPGYYVSHCANCFVRNLAMIPCQTCSLLMFCDEKCRDESMTRYHAIECRILSLLRALGVGKMELLTIRILMIATQQGRSISDLFDDPIFGDPIPSKPLDINNVYNSESYQSVHTLEDNFSKRPLSDSFQRAAISAILLHVIKSTSFFDHAKSNSTPEKMQDLLDFAGSLLLKYLCIVICNAHEISELVKDDPKLSKMGNGTLEIGGALYPLLSLINHSCDPNVVRHSYHGSVVLRAIQPITKDEQIFDNYGHHYAMHDLKKRQEILKSQYFFVCDCTACKFNWPLYKNLPSKNPTYLSTNVSFAELEQHSKNFTKMMSDIMNLKLDGVLERLCHYLSLLHKSIQRPWKEYSECQEAIKECLAHRGNNYIYLRDSMPILSSETDH